MSHPIYILSPPPIYIYLHLSTSYLHPILHLFVLGSFGYLGERPMHGEFASRRSSAERDQEARKLSIAFAIRWRWADYLKTLEWQPYFNVFCIVLVSLLLSLLLNIVTVCSVWSVCFCRSFHASWALNWHHQPSAFFNAAVSPGRQNFRFQGRANLRWLSCRSQNVMFSFFLSWWVSHSLT